jgi:hypothetical protein
MLSYSRNMLLGSSWLFSYVAKQTTDRSIYLISSEVWNRLKTFDILSPYRGKRGGRTNDLPNTIRTVFTRRINNQKRTRSRPFINPNNLLNIQIDSSRMITNSEQQQQQQRPSPLERTYFVPSLLLSNRELTQGRILTDDVDFSTGCDVIFEVSMRRGRLEGVLRESTPSKGHFRRRRKAYVKKCTALQFHQQRACYNTVFHLEYPIFLVDCICRL